MAVTMCDFNNDCQISIISLAELGATNKVHDVILIFQENFKTTSHFFS